MNRWLMSMMALVAAGAAAEVSERAPVRVRVLHPEVRAADRWLAGSVAAVRHAQISTRAAAVVREVRVQEGDRVAAGAVLVRLADGDLRAQEAAARQTLDAALANERRVRELVRDGHLPAAQLEPAQAQRAQAEAQLGAAREALSYAEIRAPFAGTVLAKLVAPGDLVSPGQPMIELAGSALEIVASATEGEARALSAGLHVAFATGEERGEAQITAVSAGGDPVSHRGTVRALVVSGPASLRSGEFVRLRLPATEGSQRIWVPRSALVERGDLTGVFVVREGRAQLRWLAMGEEDSGAASVRAGLQGGEALVDGPAGLRDGDRVEVADGR